MHFSPPIESIRSKTKNIESRYISIIERAVGALSFSICREELIVRDQDPSLEPGSLNVHAEICSVTGVARTIRTSAAHVLLCSVILLLSWLSLCEETPVRTSTHGG